jgi:hypothetical protein
VDGQLLTTLKGDRIVEDFLSILSVYVQEHFAR